MDRVKRTEVQLPQFLPSKYKSWLDLYQHVVAELSSYNAVINDETEVDLREFDREFDDAEFSQKFKMSEIKCKAFDYVLSMLPNKKDMIQVAYMAKSAAWTNDVDKIHGILNNLIAISNPDS